LFVEGATLAPIIALAPIMVVLQMAFPCLIIVERKSTGALRKEGWYGRCRATNTSAGDAAGLFIRGKKRKSLYAFTAAARM
jgi:hypothetical protein